MAKNTATKRKPSKTTKKVVKKATKLKQTTVEKTDKYALMKQVLANPEKFPIFRKHLDTLNMLKEAITSQIAIYKHLKKVFNADDRTVVEFNNDKWEGLPELIEVVRLNAFISQMNQASISNTINEFL